MKKELLGALAAGVVALLLVFVPAVAQEREFVDFDNHDANQPGSPGIQLDLDAYARQGVRFEGGTVLSYEPGFASSELNGIEMCYAEEFCTTPFTMGFDRAMRSVSVRVGFRGTLDEPASVLMVAFDEEGQRVAVQEIVIGPGSPVPIDLELGVVDQAGRITVVQIRWSDAQRVMNGLALDDLVFEPFFPFFELFAEPSEVVFEPIEIGASMTRQFEVFNVGNVPGELFVTIEDSTGHITLAGTSCSGGLDPGASCTVEIELTAADLREYAGAVAIRSGDGEPILIIPARGSLFVPGTVPPPEPPPPGLTVVTSIAAPGPDPAGPSVPPWIWILAGGGAIAVGVTYRSIRRNRPQKQSPRTSQPTVQIRSGESEHVVEPSRDAAAVAIRVGLVPDSGTTTLIEERQ